MKIGIVTNLYPPYTRGGAEQVIVRTVGQLLAMGHDVFVITGKPKSAGNYVELDRSSTERVYRVRSKNIYFTLDDHKYSRATRLLWHVIDAFGWSAARAVREIVEDERPDVVVTHNLKGIGLTIPMVLRSLGVPHVHVVHDVQLIHPSGLIMHGKERQSIFLRPLLKLYQMVCSLLFGNPPIVISPSRYLEEMYTDSGLFSRSKMVLMPNPAPNYADPLDRARSPGPLKLLFVGQLAAHKGIRFLLDVFASYSGEARLLIAGDGQLRSLVERRALADKRIIYLGYTPSEEMPKVFQVVDAVVVPSLCYENSPTVIYEALQSGIPVIASRIGGVAELLVEGKSGLLIEPGNPQALLEAIQLMDKQKEAFSHARAAIHATVADYSLEKYAIRFVQALEEAIAVTKERSL